MNVVLADLPCTASCVYLHTFFFGTASHVDSCHVRSHAPGDKRHFNSSAMSILTGKDATGLI